MKIEALKFPIFGVLASVAFAGAAALPQVTDVTFSRRSKGAVQVDYTLDRAAVVTFDVVTNGVSIGAANLTTVAGDVFCEVPAGRHRIRWSAGTEWSGHKADDLDVRVQAWALDDKPDYMVVNLADGAIAYYPSVEWLPGGLLNGTQYKTEKLVLRRIHAKDVTWTMGGQGESDNASFVSAIVDDDHSVTLTNDYYFAVFETTEKQFETIYGKEWGTQRGDCYPQTGVRYFLVRENANGGSTGNAAYQYPNPPCPDSFLGKLRVLTGGIDFELPSEAQWEFAARGDSSPRYYNNNVYASNKFPCPGACKGTTSGAYAEVGSYEPNIWGIYDCHGNASSWCLDWYNADIRDLNGAVCLTPSDSDPRRSIRGMDVGKEAGIAQRVSRRAANIPRGEASGIRLMCVNGLK